MGLKVQGPRPLSPLEQEAVKLVFRESLDPCGDVYLTVLEHLDGHAGENRGFGNIRISKAKFSRTGDLNIDSTSANTKILKSANIQYLSTLIHECTHQWQWNYERYLDAPSDVKLPYDFAREELQAMKFLKKYHKNLDKPGQFPEKAEFMKEQHASIAQVYFMIAWQLKHLPKGSDVNLSYEGPDRVGLANRYHEIRKLDDDNDGRLFVSRDIAEDLAHHFSAYLVELRSGGREQWGG